jgi:hypothetical protein
MMSDEGLLGGEAIPGGSFMLMWQLHTSSGPFFTTRTIKPVLENTFSFTLKIQ